MPIRLDFLLKGSVIGFLMAVPVGPIGILCIRRSLACGRISGFFSGLGAATADALYGTIAAWGITFTSCFLNKHQNIIQLIGAGFLLILGTKIFLETLLTEEQLSCTTANFVRDYISALFLTLANPLTILSFAAVFAGFGLTDACGNYWQALFLVVGVFCGSGLWWLTLSSTVGLMHKRITPRATRLINKISGAIIICFGLGVLINVLIRIFG